MAIILKEGKAHKHMAWFTACSTCNSMLKILQGDPLATDPVCYNCDARQYYVRYVCPICGAKMVAKTGSSFGEKGNARYEEIILEEEDKKEMESWKDIVEFDEDSDRWVKNRFRV